MLKLLQAEKERARTRRAFTMTPTFEDDFIEDWAEQLPDVEEVLGPADPERPPRRTVAFDIAPSVTYDHGMTVTDTRPRIVRPLDHPKRSVPIAKPPPSDDDDDFLSDDDFLDGSEPDGDEEGAESDGGEFNQVDGDDSGRFEMVIQSHLPPQDGGEDGFADEFETFDD
jgi:hypothetical protein